MSTPAPLHGPARRSLVLGGVAVTLHGLAGCTDDAADSSVDGSVDGPSGAPTLPQPGRNPDHDLVVAALAVEQAHLDRVRAVTRVHRRVRWLRQGLVEPASIHLAHVELLRGAVEDDVPAPDGAAWRVPPSPGRALAALAASARTVRMEQVDVAMSAQSGRFARVAAAMAAAAAQQEQLLAELAARGRGAGA